MIASVVCSISQLKLLIALEEQSTTDAVTGILSRRAGRELLELLFAKSEREKTSFSLILVDFDRFKEINDGHGHDAGDHVLRNAAQGLKSKLRREDALIRWGGEEFLLVFSGLPAESASQLILTLCQ